MLIGERKWAAWITICQTIVIKREYPESIALQILSLALQVNTEEKISGDPDAMTRQAEEFIRYATHPGTQAPLWLDKKES